ncbi:mechanosensitive ion channel domain-containing protein [uncultured Prevotellamassilia sp.]|uniref:mechanosensitive ion channel family protein n=1 Tax=uncultured Prevotellamassilia sp. TaxID=1926676 RepID=UPI00258D5A6F|nr:mechanosensitive ion channel domain-containing protein [uncultured Prevotellamassilia sp.]
MLLDKLLALSLTAGKRILVAVLIYIAGRFVIKIINRVVSAMLSRRHVDVGVQSFLRSLVHILLTILLIISVISALGINTTSFAALLASAGVAVGMALSGNLQNFAGGLVILLFKPYRVGDLIEAQGTLGRVREIQIFHTILTTYDNKVVYIPNGSLSTSVVVNHSREDTRRVQWIMGVDYGQDIDVVRQKVLALFASDPRILQTPDAHKPFVGVEALADSSVNLVVRVWVNTDDYWPVFYQGQQQLYDMFNREGINIPYPQQVVHVAKT